MNIPPVPDTLVIVPVQEGVPPAISFKGHRIDLNNVLARYKHGMTAEQIVQAYPTLDLCSIQAAIDYYENNKAAIDEYLQELDAYFEHVRLATPLNPIQTKIEQLMKQRHPAA